MDCYLLKQHIYCAKLQGVLFVSCPISGPCQEGYYCEGGAYDAVPTATVAYPENGLCPEGHYCDEGTRAPTQCPVGTIREIPGQHFIYSYCL